VSCVNRCIGTYSRVPKTNKLPVTGTNFRQAMQTRCQVVPGAELDCEEDSTQLWIEVLMRHFVGGPILSVTCIGVTRGHSRL